MTDHQRFTKIKQNVWKMESGGAVYSVKKYESLAQAVKVRQVHQVLSVHNFPHIVPVLEKQDPLLLIQPWLEGARAVNFKRRIDRIDSFKALQALHDTKSQVDWSTVSCLPYYHMLEKWDVRLAKFLELQEMCEQFLPLHTIEELLAYGQDALKICKKQAPPVDSLTLLHGDVVHHNILRDASGQIRFIDFDLACLGTAEDERVLWMHRVLPQISYNPEFLMGEHPDLQTLSNQSLAKLLYPNEVLREWLHLLSLPAAQRQRMVNKLLQFTETALSHWPRLWYDVERMMK
ncbi:aminoglycoside phosphotransferase family protein [Sporosarcina sp. GW1-11]|uniref:aminoglycoside phosphotransferase family protein n=1 Tax=Sporosarcina sp. GW1-11 TaxID=2899126 RepID=UPI00294E1364|nr:aminoglycoside phosphotransferase family protein [Sporosarcina sp. GW1-11]MDV6377205.1 aminoglycoside phosphotransferase family protein [Sporosarcina sp. GW1-11]